MNVQQQQEQFYQWMTRVKTLSGSRAALSTTDRRLTEMSNGVLISRYALPKGA